MLPYARDLPKPEPPKVQHQPVNAGVQKPRSSRNRLGARVKKLEEEVVLLRTQIQELREEKVPTLCGTLTCRKN
jgi:hypothetical protein